MKIGEFKLEGTVYKIVLRNGHNQRPYSFNHKKKEVYVADTFNGRKINYDILKVNIYNTILEILSDRVDIRLTRPMSNLIVQALETLTSTFKEPDGEVKLGSVSYLIEENEDLCEEKDVPRFIDPKIRVIYLDNFVDERYYKIQLFCSLFEAVLIELGYANEYQSLIKLLGKGLYNIEETIQIKYPGEDETV